MENKELIKNVTYNESGCERPLEESVISFLQILIPKPTTPDAKDDEPLSYKNCNSFELIYVKRMPKERGKVISDKPDELIEHSRGYGDATKPEDYLNLPDEFQIPPGDIISLDIRNMEDVTLTSEMMSL